MITRFLIVLISLFLLSGCAYNPPTDDELVTRKLWQSRHWEFHSGNP